ncbi:MAG: helix-turn-helix domain-containing protein [Candidatus Limnocylindrales bacterium]
MNRLASSSDRPYRSRLREEQTVATRGRVLDATVRVMAGGAAFVSIPAVAREAGVSVPTIYRHFGSKRDLLTAVYPHIVRRAGLDEMVAPRSLPELRDGVRALFSRVESFDQLARAAMASPASEEARRINMPDRIEMSRAFANSIHPNLARPDRDRLARLMVILLSSSALRLWRDHLGASIDQAADDIDWIVRTAVAASNLETGS